MIKKIALIVSLAIFIVYGFSTPAFAADEEEWELKLDAAKLYWGNTVTIEGYEIKAEDFSEDKVVFITISKNGKKLKIAPLSEGLEVSCNSELKVYAQKVDPNYEVITKDGKEFRTGNWKPYAELDIFIKGKPNLDIDVETEKDTYDSKMAADSRIDVTIKVKNDGKAKAKDLVLTVDAAGFEVVGGKTRYTYATILKDQTLEPVNLKLKAPTPWEDTKFKIAIKAAYQDASGKKYEQEGSKTIEIQKKWALVLTKTTTKERHMGEPVYVTVTARNGGLCDINDIKIKDSIVSGMHPQKDIVLDKTVSLKSGDAAEKIFEYVLIPEYPGEFAFPKATANFTLPNGESKELNSIDSDNTKIYGPNIIITKTVDKQNLNKGDELTVTVTAQNTGNVDASVTVTDIIPPIAKFIRGETNFKQILESGGSKTITYVLQMRKEGDIQLPACKASFYDLDKYSGEVSSNTPPIVYSGTDISPEKGSEQSGGSTGSNAEKNASYEGGKTVPKEGEYGDTPGFNAFLAIAGFLAGTGLLRKRNA
jgi:uncharacterized repeat protein (TIGR01451 family)